MIRARVGVGIGRLADPRNDFGSASRGDPAR
jgi:hypothetical protein